MITAPIAAAQETLARVQEMSREEVIHELGHFRGRVRLDFTRDYLDRLPLDRLRHILQAALLELSVI